MLKQKKFKTIVIAAIVGIALLIVAGMAVSSLGRDEGSHTVHPAEGGEWDFGASAGRTWSNFLHDRPHSASVQGHKFVDSGCVRGGDWARAEAPSKWIPVGRNEQSKALC